MRTRQRYFLAALITAVSFAVPTTPAPSAAAPVSAIGTDIHYCPAGTAWDNLRQRCV